MPGLFDVGDTPTPPAGGVGGRKDAIMNSVWLVTLLLILLGPSALVLFVRKALVVVTVTLHSMEPTLSPGDRVLVLKYWPRRRLRKGQIVIVWPWEPSERRGPFGVERPYIKRIVGMPGERLVTSLAELSEIHREDQRPWHDASGMRVWEIPPGHCFVRGDYPIGGFDSLSWGPVPDRAVLGVVVKRLRSRPDASEVVLPAEMLYREPAQR
jgi:signal peptidase I